MAGRVRWLFRRRRRDWDWGLYGGPKTLRAHEENIAYFPPKVTYPSGLELAPLGPTFPVPQERDQEQPREGKILAEEAARLSTMQGAIFPVETKAVVETLAPATSDVRVQGKVVLGFENGKIVLQDGNPLVKEFVRAADRMMRPKRRIFGKVGA